MKAPVTFYLDNLPVGFFQDNCQPLAEGEYKYMPYRGPGHYNLGLQLRASRIPRCYYTSDAGRVEFSVLAHVEYGVLRLSDFETAEGKQ